MSYVLIVQCDDCNRTLKIVHLRRRDIEKIHVAIDETCHYCEGAEEYAFI